jgi:hypothetical protein
VCEREEGGSERFFRAWGDTRRVLKWLKNVDGV